MRKSALNERSSVLSVIYTPKGSQTAYLDKKNQPPGAVLEPQPSGFTKEPKRNYHRGVEDFRRTEGIEPIRKSALNERTSVLLIIYTPKRLQYADCYAGGLAFLSKNLNYARLAAFTNPWAYFRRHIYLTFEPY
jgi:hypothetical protein